MVTVPDVVNLTQAAATAAITGAGLTVGTVTTASSTTVAAGLVISENPAALSQVLAGSAVSIVVSSGPPSAAPIVDKVVFSDGSGTRTTAAFSTSSPNETLVAFVASDGPNAAQTVTVSGAGLAWTLVKRANVQRGTSEIWKATATSLLSNVTVRSTPAASGFQQSLTVVTFASAGGVGASSIANAPTGAPTVSLTTTKAGSLVYAVGNDWDKAAARTPAAGQAIVHQYLPSVGDTMWVQNLVGPVASLGTVVQIRDTAPTTDRWNLACVEITP
jgi:hypothetical protein